MYYTYFVLTMYLLCTVGRVHGLHGGPRQEPAARALRARRRPGGHPVRVRGDNQRRSSPSLSSVHASLSSIVRLPSPFLSCSLSYLNGSAIVPSSFSLSLLRTHQLSFGLGARPCQTSAAQHIPCVGCCRMARLYIHTMRRLFVAVCSYAAPFFCCHDAPERRNCSTTRRSGRGPRAACSVSSCTRSSRRKQGRPGRTWHLRPDATKACPRRFQGCRRSCSTIRRSLCSWPTCCLQSEAPNWRWLSSAPSFTETVAADVVAVCTASAKMKRSMIMDESGPVAARGGTRCEVGIWTGRQSIVRRGQIVTNVFFLATRMSSASTHPGCRSS